MNGLLETTYFWALSLALIAAVCFYLFYKVQMKLLEMGILVICLLVGAYFLYDYLGRPKELRAYYAPQAKQNRKAQNQIRPLITKMTRQITKLEFHVLKQPQDLKAWWQLGQLYQIKQDYANAKRAFQQAAKLSPQNVNLKAQFASASLRANQGRLDQPTLKVVKAILAQAPDHTIALNLLALNAYYTDNYKDAIEYWQKLKGLVARDPKQQHLKPMLEKMIQQAKIKEK